MTVVDYELVILRATLRLANESVEHLAKDDFR